MSSSITPDTLAIRLANVSKIYRLHGSQRDQLIDVLGLQRIGFRTRTPTKEFSALSDISLDVPKGHRIGIVGRNGAGKTTLLKLICGNFAPTSGTVEVNGSVQALMNVGLGFHPEYTGRENVEAALQYNGLSRDEYHDAMEGIIEFCELGDFIDQPFKTYSLGMQARLMFAAATAIKPDILIVDEVLGAGDAYFVAKSRMRVEKMVSSGCTMLLVSHSMQQILELCTEAVWLDQGRVRMRGESFLVVKAYEEYLHGPVARISLPASPTTPPENEVVVPSDCTVLDLPPEQPIKKSRFKEYLGDIRLQEPLFVPHDEEPLLPEIDAPKHLTFLAPGGVCRWESVGGLKICGFTIVTERGITNKLVSMRPAKIVFTLVAERGGHFNCRYALAIYDHLGRCMLDIVSAADTFESDQGALRVVEILLNPVQLGPGAYTASVSAHKYEPLEVFNSTERYDLLGRSFAFDVELPESLGAITAQFYHTAEWNCRAG